MRRVSDCVVRRARGLLRPRPESSEAIATSLGWRQACAAHQGLRCGGVLLHETSQGHEVMTKQGFFDTLTELQPSLCPTNWKGLPQRVGGITREVHYKLDPKKTETLFSFSNSMRSRLRNPSPTVEHGSYYALGLKQYFGKRLFSNQASSGTSRDSKGKNANLSSVGGVSTNTATSNTFCFASTSGEMVERTIAPEAQLQYSEINRRDQVGAVSMDPLEPSSTGQARLTQEQGVPSFLQRLHAAAPDRHRKRPPSPERVMIPLEGVNALALVEAASRKWTKTTHLLENVRSLNDAAFSDAMKQAIESRNLAITAKCECRVLMSDPNCAPKSRQIYMDLLNRADLLHARINEKIKTVELTLKKPSFSKGTKYAIAGFLGISVAGSTLLYADLVNKLFQFTS